jgi:hypothetical protein
VLGPVSRIFWKSGDVTETEALQYMNSQGIDTELAKRVHALVGGRMVFLKYAVNNLQGGLSIEGM